MGSKTARTTIDCIPVWSVANFGGLENLTGACQHFSSGKAVYFVEGASAFHLVRSLPKVQYIIEVSVEDSYIAARAATYLWLTLKTRLEEGWQAGMTPLMIRSRETASCNIEDDLLRCNSERLSYIQQY